MTLPEDASAGLPSRGQVAVEGAINGRRFQAVLEPDGRRGHWLKVDRGLQDALGAGEGETVSLEVEPTKQWPEPDIPKDFQAALADAPDISELWGDITSMARWEWVRWINATRNLRRVHDASKSLSRSSGPESGGLAASICPRAPTRTYPETGSSLNRS